MFGAGITHVRLFIQCRRICSQYILLSTRATMGIWIYWMSRQVMFGRRCSILQWAIFYTWFKMFPSCSSYWVTFSNSWVAVGFNTLNYLCSLMSGYNIVLASLDSNNNICSSFCSNPMLGRIWSSEIFILQSHSSW